MNQDRSVIHPIAATLRGVPAQFGPFVPDRWLDLRIQDPKIPRSIGPKTLMRICYIHPARYPTLLANPIHVVNTCAAMADLGHDVTLVIRAAEGAPRGVERSLYDEYGVDESFKISVFPHHQFILRGLIQYRRLKRLLHEYRPDLTYSRTTKPAWAWTSAGIPSVFETHLDRDML